MCPFLGYLQHKYIVCGGQQTVLQQQKVVATPQQQEHPSSVHYIHASRNFVHSKCHIFCKFDTALSTFNILHCTLQKSHCYYAFRCSRIFLIGRLWPISIQRQRQSTKAYLLKGWPSLWSAFWQLLFLLWQTMQWQMVDTKQNDVDRPGLLSADSALVA